MVELDFGTLPLGLQIGDKIVAACPGCGKHGVWQNETNQSDFIHGHGVQPTAGGFIYGWTKCSFPRPLLESETR